mmetsp:Transcript_39255/g.122871  ORF Transcript_39255/g.122871 Transcript_39255/m.122871 type:complete len:174 (-) Transcript_39255:203-724(-)
MKNLRKRLGVFYRNMPPSEYRFLMNKKDELKFEDLKELLMDNEVRGVDPVAEAFKAYEPDETGAIRPETLRRVFQDLGFGEIAEDDVEILTETADINKDGKITLEDFRALLESPNGAACTPITPTSKAPRPCRASHQSPLSLAPAREAPEEAAEREAATPEDDDAGGEEDDES